MKIYFMSSPRGKKDRDDNFALIYESIKSLGHDHTTDFLLNVDVDNFYMSDIHKFYQKTIKDLKSAELCVFETSAPSLAVGQLISIALENEKPVIALHTKGNLPFFLSGSNEDKVQVVEYERGSLKKQLEMAIDYSLETIDTRFNFFISPQIGSYLDWVAKEKRVPRAVYLRRLIEQDMRKNKDLLE